MSVPYFIIKPAITRYDVEQADACYKAALSDLMQKNPIFAKFDKMRTASIKNVTSDDSCLFIGICKGLIVGTAYVEKRPDHTCLVLYVSVHPTMQNRGIGRMMNYACIDWAKEHRAKSIFSEVYENNRPAEHLCQRIGYKLQHRQEYEVEEGEMPWNIFRIKF